MIEETILELLSNRLDVPVYMEYPAEKPLRFVVLEKTAGGEENHINSAMFAVQSVAERMIEAASLNECVKDAMNDALICPEIASCRLNTDYNFTDPKTGKYRYQAVYEITHY